MGPGTQGPNYLHTKGRTTNGSKLWFKYNFGMILCIVHFLKQGPNDAVPHKLYSLLAFKKLSSQPKYLHLQAALSPVQLSHCNGAQSVNCQSN